MTLRRIEGDRFVLTTSTRPRAYIEFEVSSAARADRKVFAHILKMERRVLLDWKRDNRASAP